MSEAETQRRTITPLVLSSSVIVVLTILFLTGFDAINLLLAHIPGVPPSPWITEVWQFVWRPTIPEYILRVGQVFGLVSVAMLAVRPIAPVFVDIVRFRESVWQLVHRRQWVKIGALLALLAMSVIVVEYPTDPRAIAVGISIFVVRYTYVLIPDVLFGTVLREGERVTVVSWTKVLVSSLILTTVITVTGVFFMGWLLYVV
jgi:hypothetical protein